MGLIATHDRSLVRCLASLSVAALLAVTGCGSDDETANDPDNAEGDDGGRSTRGATEDTAAGSDLAREGTDVSSDVAREVSETLSELDAETRSGDTVVTIPDEVIFAFGDHELLPDAIPVLDDLVVAIDYFADAPIRVNGHTDSVGSDAANQTLSERRAQAVVDHITDAGVNPSRLHAQGFGESHPVAPNTHRDGTDNPDGRTQNRRVEIVIEGVDLSASDLPVGS